MKLVAFGITGDLMRLKILPALQKLQLDVIGISRKPRDTSIIPEGFGFLQGDTASAETFAQLKKMLGGEPAIFYFSISPSLYAEAFKNMGAVGFPRTTKIMVEKPFGRSGAEAEQLFETLKTITEEENIFLVDHYLAKDWVRGLKALRAPKVPSISEGIEKIEVRFLETLGVEKRGVLYDQLGILRDVGQNHMLQILAHILGTAAKMEVVTTVRAQYEGYKDIDGAAPNSQTETYFKIEATRGDIKITLEAGKRMSENKKEVVITYKNGISETISETPNAVAEYELLIAAAMKGERNLFVPIEDIRAQWKFIDPILEMWNEGRPELLVYAPSQKP